MTDRSSGASGRAAGRLAIMLVVGFAGAGCTVGRASTAPSSSLPAATPTPVESEIAGPTPRRNAAWGLLRPELPSWVTVPEDATAIDPGDDTARLATALAPDAALAAVEPSLRARSFTAESRDGGASFSQAMLVWGGDGRCEILVVAQADADLGATVITIRYPLTCPIDPR